VRLVRTGIGILLLMLGALWVGPAAHAQYPPTVGAGRVSRSELKQCQCTLFSGDGFVPGTPVAIVDEGPDGTSRIVATVTADDKGGFKEKVCFDSASAQGGHTLVAQGTEPGGGAHEDRASVTVAGSVCNTKSDEVHPKVSDAGSDTENRDGGSAGAGSGAGGAGSGSGNGSSGSGTSVSGVGVRGVDLPRTGADVILPGLAVGFCLVLAGAGVVHLSHRRRLAAG
jgi:hypothetical protein